MNTSLANIQRDGTCTLDIFRAKCFPDNTQWCSHIDWAAVLMKIMAKWRFLNMSESDAVICSAHLSLHKRRFILRLLHQTSAFFSFVLLCKYCVTTSRNRCIEPSCRLCFSLPPLPHVDLSLQVNTLCTVGALTYWDRTSDFTLATGLWGQGCGVAVDLTVWMSGRMKAAGYDAAELEAPSCFCVCGCVVGTLRLWIASP